MATGDIEVKKVDTLFDELDRVHQAIRERAYDLFRSGGTLWGSALRDWLTAEREVVSKPPIELRQSDNQFEVLTALPGIEMQHHRFISRRRSSPRARRLNTRMVCCT